MVQQIDNRKLKWLWRWMKAVGRGKREWQATVLWKPKKRWTSAHCHRKHPKNEQSSFKISSCNHATVWDYHPHLKWNSFPRIILINNTKTIPGRAMTHLVRQRVQREAEGDPFFDWQLQQFNSFPYSLSGSSIQHLKADPDQMGMYRILRISLELLYCTFLCVYYSV